MRRFFLWYLPLLVGICAAVTFGWGLVSFLRGDVGTPVDIAPVEAATKAAQPQQRIVPVIVGDSLARGAGDPSGLGIAGRFDQEVRRRNLRAASTTNLGVSGARTADLLRQLDSANVRRLLGEANVIIVSIGGNDLWGGADWRTATPPNPDATMSEVLDRVTQVVEKVRAANPRARIFFIGLYNPFASTPMGAQLGTFVNRWNSRLVEKFGGDPNFSVVQTADLFSHRDRLALDRFHPGAEGYGLIARRIADAL